MTKFEHPDFSMHQDDFDKSLEAVMNNEAQVTHVKHATLSSHPIYEMLLEGPGELNPPHEGSVKMTLPMHHAPEVDIGNRVKAIGEFFNSALSVEHWQNLADQHPASKYIRQELQAALNATLMPNSHYWSTVHLQPLMDRLDNLGFKCAFDKESVTFSILFSEGCNQRLNDVQKDLRNKPLIDKINAGSSFLDKKPTVEVGETANGWVDPVTVYNRTLVWKIVLQTPAHPERRATPRNPDVFAVGKPSCGKEYVYTG